MINKGIYKVNQGVSSINDSLTYISNKSLGKAEILELLGCKESVLGVITFDTAPFFGIMSSPISICYDKKSNINTTLKICTPQGIEYFIESHFIIGVNLTHSESTSRGLNFNIHPLTDFMFRVLRFEVLKLIEDENKRVRTLKHGVYLK